MHKNRGKNIIIRLNGGEKSGMGHVFRMVCLAQVLIEDHKISFVINNCVGLKTYLEENRFSVRTLPVSPDSCSMQQIDPDYQKDEIQDLIQIMIKEKTQTIIFDLLNVGDSYFQAVRPHVDKVIAFDNISPSRLSMDLVINTLWFGKEDQNYDHILTGHQNLLLRPQVYDCCHAVPQIVKNVYIAMGGADVNGLTLRVLKSMEPFMDGLKLHVVTTNLNFEKETLKAYCREKQISFYLDPPNVFKIMDLCDIAVCGGGITLYELLSKGIPCVMVKQCENEFEFSTLPSHLVIESNLTNHVSQSGNLSRSEQGVGYDFQLLRQNFSLRKKINAEAMSNFNKNNYAKLLHKIKGVISDV